MLIIKMYPLPLDLTEDEFIAIHEIIVAEVVAMEAFGITSEDDMTVHFPPDGMKKGLGSDIVVEVLGDLFCRRGDLRPKFAHAMFRVIRRFFPKAIARCIISPFADRFDFYQLLPGEKIPKD